MGLDDGTTICASHIVAADGKWSVVRAAFFEDWCPALLDAITYYGSTHYGSTHYGSAYYGSTHYRCSAFLDGEPANGECSRA